MKLRPLAVACRFVFLASIAVGLQSVFTASSASAEDFDRAKLAEIRDKMKEFVDRQDIAGAVTVVGRKSSVASHESVGYLNLEKPEPMPKNALFRIASMTKPITAIGIMILVDEGELSVDDAVDRHLPEFRGQMLVASRSADMVTLKKPSRVREPQGVSAMLSSGTFGHGGAFGTQGWIDPQKDLFVILLIQRVGLPNADASDVRRELQLIAVSALQN